VLKRGPTDGGDMGGRQYRRRDGIASICERRLLLHDALLQSAVEADRVVERLRHGHGVGPLGGSGLRELALVPLALVAVTTK